MRPEDGRAKCHKCANRTETTRPPHPTARGNRISGQRGFRGASKLIRESEAAAVCPAPRPRRTPFKKRPPSLSWGDALENAARKSGSAAQLKSSHPVGKPLDPIQRKQHRPSSAPDTTGLQIAVAELFLQRGSPVEMNGTYSRVSAMRAGTFVSKAPLSKINTSIPMAWRLSQLFWSSNGAS